MNKIIIGNKIDVNSENIKVDNNNVTFLKSGLYEVEYLADAKKKINFNIDKDVTILEYGLDGNIEINNHYIVSNGILDIYKFYSCHNIHEVVNIDLCNELVKVNCKYSGISREEYDFTINVNHLAKDTESNIINKMVALTNSDTSFIVNSKVVKKAVKSNLNQVTRIVTMGECDTKILPNMYIDLEDVSAKHGSIIGTFKDEDIFYLMSKGINYNDTLKLLIKGYLLSNMLPNHEIRKKIMDIINEYWR